MDVQAYMVRYAVPLLGGIVIAYLVASSLAAWYRLRHIKGPFLASVSYLWIYRNTSAGQQGESYGALVEKYGDVVRIGPNEVITSDADAIRRMNAARSSYKRDEYYKALQLHPYHEHLTSITDTRTHDRKKAQMSHGYGGKDVPSLEKDIDEIVATLVELLRSKYASTKVHKPADLAALSQFFTLDVITKIAYGNEFGYLRNESDVYGYIAASNATHSLCRNSPLEKDSAEFVHEETFWPQVY